LAPPGQIGDPDPEVRPRDWIIAILGLERVKKRSMQLRVFVFSIMVSAIGIPAISATPIEKGMSMSVMTQAAQTAEPVSPAATDKAAIAALDVEFQRAVKVNDAATIDRILHRDYWLVLGNGNVVTRDELIEEARQRTIEYEVQDEVPGTQQVRVWGDTGVVTAKLQIKGKQAGKSFSRTLWFSDTYVRTEEGWKYAFAQASLPLPQE
jgi:ketosteroid isomerase-like protein